MQERRTDRSAPTCRSRPRTSNATRSAAPSTAAVRRSAFTRRTGRSRSRRGLDSDRILIRETSSLIHESTKVDSRDKLVDSRINQGCFARRKFFRARQETLPGEPNSPLEPGKLLLHDAKVFYSHTTDTCPPNPNGRR